MTYVVDIFVMCTGVYVDSFAIGDKYRDGRNRINGHRGNGYGYGASYGYGYGFGSGYGTGTATGSGRGG